MCRLRLTAVVAIAMLVMAGCGSSTGAISNRFGDCTIAPHTVCENQNLAAVSLESSDLTGANFSGSDLTNADLSGAILKDATLVGANLSAVDLTRADLRGANLTNATLFRAQLGNADWVGSNRTGTKFCQTLLPDRTFSDCKALEGGGPASAVAPPVIVRFEPRRPLRCLDDGVGQGIETDWAVRRANGVVFLVDDIQASSATGSHGVKRVPVQCNRERHTITMKAFGTSGPAVQSSFEITLAPN